MCLLFLANAFAQPDFAGPSNYHAELLPLAEWGLNRRIIPAEINLATWPPGKPVRCGNALWSHTVWTLGFVRIDRVNR